MERSEARLEGGEKGGGRLAVAPWGEWVGVGFDLDGEGSSSGWGSSRNVSTATFAAVCRSWHCSMYSLRASFRIRLA
jgi:hypothetical protein